MINALTDEFESSTRMSRRDKLAALQDFCEHLDDLCRHWENRLNITVPMVLSEAKSNQIGHALQEWLKSHMSVQSGNNIAIQAPPSWPRDVRDAASRAVSDTYNTVLTPEFLGLCKSAGVFAGELIRSQNAMRAWVIGMHPHRRHLVNCVALASSSDIRRSYFPTHSVAGIMYRTYIWRDTPDEKRLGISALIREHCRLP